MTRKNRPDSLIIFLICSLVLLLSLYPKSRLFFPSGATSTSATLNFDDLIQFPDQGLQKSAAIKVLNENMQIELSLDGGDSFRNYSSGELVLSTFENPEILYRNTSIRWRHPEGEFPTLSSSIIQVSDNKSNKKSERKVLTYFDTLCTELPIVNISIRESSLFGWENGLMIYGQDANYDEGFHKMWWFRNANFTRRGKESEAIAQFQYFKKGKLMLDVPSKFKISGNATRSFPQKSFRLKPLDRDNDKYKFPFWAEKGNKKSESIVFRNGGNDNSKTMFADLLMQTIAYGDNVLTQQGTPVVVFLNGNYWGIYNLRERIDEYFIAKHIGTKSKYVTILENALGELKDGELNDKERFDLFINDLDSLSKLNLTVKCAALLDSNISLNSFVDYVFYETFYANNDWPANNCIFYSIKGGKWSWVLNDLDYSLSYPGDYNLTNNIFENLANSGTVTGKIYRAFMSDESLKQRFIERSKYLLNKKMTDSNIRNTVDLLKEKYASDIALQIKRWHNIGSVEEWEENIEKNVNFLIKRKKVYLQHLNEL
jgi:hypothetical protein